MSYFAKRLLKLEILAFFLFVSQLNAALFNHRRKIISDARSVDDFKNEELRLQFEDLATLKFPQEAEEGEHIEGDLMEKNELGSITTRRNGLRRTGSLWPNATVPYEIIGPYNDQQIDILKKAFQYYAENTCVRFRPKTKDDLNYLAFDGRDDGCRSFVGRIGGQQEIMLANICFKQFGTIVHEMMHSLGFLHEQNRYDRDNYLHVQKDNIQEGMWNNFYKESKQVITVFDVPYDYNSVLHYGPKSFSKNNKPTLIPLQPEKAEQMGQRHGLTNYDLSKIIKMYCDAEYIKGPRRFALV